MIKSTITVYVCDCCELENNRSYNFLSVNTTFISTNSNGSSDYSDLDLCEKCFNKYSGYISEFETVWKNRQRLLLKERKGKNW